jgi:hypothetical protein
VTYPWILESLVIQDSILVCSPDPRIPHTAADEVTQVDVIPDAVDQSELHTIPEGLNEDSREAVYPREALPPVEADNELQLTPEEMEKLYDQFEM